MMQIVSCALALLAGVVGAGFASGREVSRFFAGHGKAAPAAVLLASGSLLFFFLRLCEKMERLGAKDAVSLCRARFGKQLGTLCAGLFFLLSAVTAGAMLAACAELCALVLPLRHAYGIGMGAALFLSLLLTPKKTRGLAAAGAALCALLPVLLMRLYCIHGGEACFYPAMAPDLPVRALADGVSYAALNAALLLGTAPMLLSLQKPMRTRAVLLFSLCFSLLLCLACAVCMKHRQIALSHPMPFLALSMQLGAYLPFALCMYAAAFSTLLALESGMRSMLPLKTAPALFVVCAVCLFFARMGFASLIQSAYPVLGAVCAGLLLLLCT